MCFLHRTDILRLGVAQSDARAVALYRQAADQEYPPAIQTLALAYQYGEMGLSRDARQFEQQRLEVAHSLKHPAMTP